MAKFHINSKGDVGVCKATNGQCPFGEEDKHYSSLDKAREAFEKENNSTLFNNIRKSSKSNITSKELNYCTAEMLIYSERVIKIDSLLQEKVAESRKIRQSKTASLEEYYKVESQINYLFNKKEVEEERIKKLFNKHKRKNKVILNDYIEVKIEDHPKESTKKEYSVIKNILENGYYSPYKD